MEGESQSVTIHPSAQLLEFEEWFCGTEMYALQKRAMDGLLRRSQLRSLAWKVFLGVLPCEKTEEEEEEQPQSSANNASSPSLSTPESISDELEKRVEDHINSIHSDKPKEDSAKPLAWWQKWTTAIARGRQVYADLRNAYLVDPREAAAELDLSLNNPLAQSEASPWNRFFQNSELEKTIDTDLARLFPEYEFFSRADVKDVMKKVLFCWSLKHPKPSYRQGMHELLGHLTYCIFREARQQQQQQSGFQHSNEEVVNKENVLCTLLDPQFIEHDCYILFEKLMDKISSWFVVAEPTKPSSSSSSSISPASGSSASLKSTALIGALLDSSSASKDSAPQKQEPELSPEDKMPVLRVCRRIQSLLLRERDPNLFHYLEKMRIEPQLYALRWLRLLFGREFHLEDVLMIWDAIFADCLNSNDFSLVEHISVAMLIFIRSHLLERDYTSCMRRLMKYPPVEDVHAFVKKAVESRRTKSPLSVFASAHTPAPAAVTPSVPAAPLSSSNVYSSPASFSAVMAGVTSHSNSNHNNMLAGISSLAEKLRGPSSSSKPAMGKPTISSSGSGSSSGGPSHAAIVAAQQAASSAEAQVMHMKRVMIRMGGRLEKIISVLQQQIVSKGTLDEDSLLISIAGAKQIKDILTFRIPDNTDMESEDIEGDTADILAMYDEDEAIISPPPAPSSSSPRLEEEDQASHHREIAITPGANNIIGNALHYAAAGVDPSFSSSASSSGSASLSASSIITRTSSSPNFDDMQLHSASSSSSIPSAVSSTPAKPNSFSRFTGSGPSGFSSIRDLDDDDDDRAPSPPVLAAVSVSSSASVSHSSAPAAPAVQPKIPLSRIELSAEQRKSLMDEVDEEEDSIFGGGSSLGKSSTSSNRVALSALSAAPAAPAAVKPAASNSGSSLQSKANILFDIGASSSSASKKPFMGFDDDDDL